MARGCRVVETSSNDASGLELRGSVPRRRTSARFFETPVDSFVEAPNQSYNLHSLLLPYTANEGAQLQITSPRTSINMASFGKIYSYPVSPRALQCSSKPHRLNSIKW